MVRPHYSARPGDTGGRAYTGTTSRRPRAKTDLPVIPVTEGLVECPTCHGGVRLVIVPGDSDLTPRLLASHRFGGSRSSGWKNRCPKSLELP